MKPWSPAADIHAACIGKEAFDSPQAAARARKRIARRWNAKRRENLAAYHCHHCHRWHLGRPVEQSLQALKKEHARFVKRGKLRYAESPPSR